MILTMFNKTNIVTLFSISPLWLDVVVSGIVNNCIALIKKYIFLEFDADAEISDNDSIGPILMLFLDTGLIVNPDKYNFLWHYLPCSLLTTVPE